MMPEEKRKKAAAVSYDAERDAAPKVLASGRGNIAEKIIEAARAAGIPIQEDAALAEVLANIEPGENIPPETYRAVAEILVFLYKLDKERGGRKLKGLETAAARKGEGE